LRFLNVGNLPLSQALVDPQGSVLTQSDVVKIRMRDVQDVDSMAHLPK